MQDSIYVEPPSIVALELVPQVPAKPQTPYQVLRLLPKDATPAQQDSAIQAWFAPEEIHYSEQPDTLHLPGEGIPRARSSIRNSRAGWERHTPTPGRTRAQEPTAQVW